MKSYSKNLSLKKKLSYKVVNTFVSKFSNGKVHSGLSYDEALKIEGFDEFYKKQIKDHSPYLLNNTHLEIQETLNLNKRSIYFIVTNKQEIIASVRLTPYPFELESLCSQFKDKSKEYQDYFEISRLQINSTIKNRRVFVKFLLFETGTWLFHHSGAKGISGVCRKERVSFFSGFGMKVISEGFIKSRKGRYYFLVATHQEMLLSATVYVFKNQINKVMKYIKIIPRSKLWKL